LQFEPIKDICGGRCAFVRMSKASILNLSAHGSPTLYSKVLTVTVAKRTFQKPSGYQVKPVLITFRIHRSYSLFSA
jgi:hypothetical protein